MPLQTGYKTYGQSGLVVSDWFQHIGRMRDDLAVVRSLWTMDNDHGAQLTWHTGRHVREGGLPTIGSWVCYGLGSLNANLPEYVVLGDADGRLLRRRVDARRRLSRARSRRRAAGHRPGAAAAVPHRRAGGPTREEQMAGLSLLGKLNTLAGHRLSRRP